MTAGQTDTQRGSRRRMPDINKIVVFLLGDGGKCNRSLFRSQHTNALKILSIVKGERVGWSCCDAVICLYDER